MSDFDYGDFDIDALDGVEFDALVDDYHPDEPPPAPIPNIRRRRQPTPFERQPSPPPAVPAPIPYQPDVPQLRRDQRVRMDNEPVVIDGGAGSMREGRADVIDLAGEDSDDGEVVYLHRNPLPRHPPPVPRPVRHIAPIPIPRRREEDDPAQRDFEAAIAPEAQQRAQDIANAEMEERRAILSPPPPPAQPQLAPGPQRRIGFGGAALINAGQNVLRYMRPARPPPAPVLVPPMPQIGDMGFAALNALYGAHRRHIIPDQLYAERIAAMNRAAGPAGGALAAAAVDLLPLPTHPPPAEPFTQDFEITDIASKAIELDNDGRVVRAPKKRKVSPKPYLACAGCPEPLRVSGAYRDGDDRVWMLRCGHVIDGRCLKRLSVPSTEEEMKVVKRFPPEGLDVLGSAEGKKGKGRKGAKAKKTEVRKPDEYAWYCPVKGCRLEHRSVKALEIWEQKEAEGAVTVYM